MFLLVCTLGKPQKSSSTYSQAIKALTPPPPSLIAIGTFYSSLQTFFVLIGPAFTLIPWPLAEKLFYGLP